MMQRMIDNDLELVEMLGEGTFAYVWSAVDHTLERQVAVKVLKQDVHKSAPQRFNAEAKIMARLQHPNIVSLLRVGTGGNATSRDGQIEYIASEFIEGVTLREWLDFESPRPEEVVTIFSQIAAAVSYANSQGIIHRDLKPENILMDISGIPHVTDFGLAIEEGVCRTMPELTVGTVAYMAPEQLQTPPRRASESTDLYSIGVMMYEALTGRLPYSGVCLADYVDQLQRSTFRPVLTIKEGIPLDLAVICDKCIQQESKSRISSAQILLEELQRIDKGIPVLSRPVSAREKLLRWSARNKSLSRVLLALVVTVLVGLTISSTLAAMFFMQKERAENTAKELSRSLALAVVSSSAHELGRTLEQIEELDDAQVSPLLIGELQQMMETVDGRSKLHLQFALAFLGQLEIDDIIAAVEVAPLDECANFVACLEKDPSHAKERVISRLDGCNDGELRLKLSVLLMYLGDPGRIRKYADCTADDNVLGDLIELLDSWRAGSRKLLYLLDEPKENSDVIYCLCLTSKNREEAAAWVDRVVERSTDSGCLAAARWARKPLVDQSENLHESFVDIGSLLWYQFEVSGNESQQPRTSCTFGDIAEFCNRVSESEGLSKCYELSDKSQPEDISSWKIDTTGSGFRLSTVGEWQEACRCGATTTFFFGKDPQHLSAFGTFRDNSDGRIAGRGSRYPNRFGLFDMYGNAGELCHTDDFKKLAWMGGHFLSRGTDCRHDKVSLFSVERFPSIGFRIVRAK